MSNKIHTFLTETEFIQKNHTALRVALKSIMEKHHFENSLNINLNRARSLPKINSRNFVKLRSNTPNLKIRPKTNIINFWTRNKGTLSCNNSIKYNENSEIDPLFKFSCVAPIRSKSSCGFNKSRIRIKSPTKQLDFNNMLLNMQKIRKKLRAAQNTIKKEEISKINDRIIFKSFITLNSKNALQTTPSKFKTLNRPNTSKFIKKLLKSASKPKSKISAFITQKPQEYSLICPVFVRIRKKLTNNL